MIDARRTKFYTIGDAVVAEHHCRNSFIRTAGALVPDRLRPMHANTVHSQFRRFFAAYSPFL